MPKDRILEIASKMGEISATIEYIYEQGTKPKLMMELFRLNDELKKMVDSL
jgi:hypothetical protein